MDVWIIGWSKQWEQAEWIGLDTPPTAMNYDYLSNCGAKNT